MTKWWLAVGSPENWQVAFDYGNIWGIRETPGLFALWQSLSRGDYVLFYATSPISGLIGYGSVRTKFRQDKPLWPQEVRESRIIWPYRFEFDVEYCLPQDDWKTKKVVSETLKAMVRGGFQVIDEGMAKDLTRLLRYVLEVSQATGHAEVQG